MGLIALLIATAVGLWAESLLVGFLVLLALIFILPAPAPARGKGGSFLTTPLCLVGLAWLLGQGDEA